MTPEVLPWHAAYLDPLQNLYSLLLAPLAFLAWRAAVPTNADSARVPEAARFVSRATLAFAVLTMVDPICTGPIAHLDALSGTFAPTAIMFFFVLLGDFRVLLIAIGVARPGRPFRQNLGWAAGTTWIVPILGGGSYFALDAVVPDLHPQMLWMLYEGAFVILCIALSRSWLPHALANEPLADEKARFLRAILGYSAAYYTLWLTADVLIVVGDLDLGWAVRMVPNQLYYAFWVPFVYGRFFSADASGANASR